LNSKAIWIYSDRQFTTPNWDISFNEEIDWESTEFNDNNVNRYYRLFNGWNLIGINPRMIDKSFNEFKGNCNILGIYGYVTNRRSWSQFPITERLDPPSLSYGLAVKVTNDCQFDFSGRSGVPQVPALPE